MRVLNIRKRRRAEGGSAPAQESAQLGDELARLADTRTDGKERISALGRVTGALATSAHAAGTSAVLRGRWLADILLDVAPRIAVRDLATLSVQHGGLRGDALADALVRSAANATGAVGAAGGALATVQWATPPTLLTVPVQLSAETLAVAAIEIKLLAELHQVYGVAPPGSPTQRALAYVSAWTHRRGVDPFEPGGLTAVLGVAAKQQLRRRLVGRLGRNLTTLGPLLTGAAAGAMVNSRETRRLAEEVRMDLRTRPVLTI
jgi:hypothetical protein